MEYGHPIITLEDLDEYISSFLPKLFYIIKEGKNTTVEIYVPGCQVKHIFFKIQGKISISIPFKVLPITYERGGLNE